MGIREIIFSLEIIVFIFEMSFISSECDAGQIDINSASKEELQEINGIGPVYAERIIELRPFNFVDNLTEVKGIGEVSLENMKNSSPSPCVKSTEDYEETSEDEEENEESNVDDSENVEEQEDEYEKEQNEEDETPKRSKKIILGKGESKEKIEPINKRETSSITMKTIKLNPIEENPKSIKSQLNEEQKHAIYGLIAFCALLLSLFIIEKVKKQKRQN